MNGKAPHALSSFHKGRTNCAVKETQTKPQPRKISGTSSCCTFWANYGDLGSLLIAFGMLILRKLDVKSEIDDFLSREPKLCRYVFGNTLMKTAHTGPHQLSIAPVHHRLISPLSQDGRRVPHSTRWSMLQHVCQPMQVQVAQTAHRWGPTGHLHAPSETCECIAK